MKYITILFLGLFLTACSITEPRVSFGKKCVEEIRQSCLFIHMDLR